MRPYVYMLGIALVGAAAGTARADDPSAPVLAGDAAGSGSADAAEAGAGGDTLVLPKGRVLVDAYLGIDLSSDFVGKPITLSPDIYYGVNDKLAVGLVHSTFGETGFMGGGAIPPGDSLCLTGSKNGCGKFYNNLALDARYSLKVGKFSWAFDGGLDFRSLSPNELSLKLGAVGRWHSDKLTIELQPELFFGLTNRTENETVGGVATSVTVNGDVLSVPVTVLYAVSPKLDVVGQTGLILPFEDTGDTYLIPLAAGINYRVNVPASILLALSFPEFLGGGSTRDARTLTLGGSYAF